MCRLFMFVHRADASSSASDSVLHAMEDALTAFFHQSVQRQKYTPNVNNPRDFLFHTDGWGIYWSELPAVNKNKGNHHRSKLTAWTDPQRDPLMAVLKRFEKSRVKKDWVVMGHLRKAVGVGIRAPAHIYNSHPFVHNNLAFAHNGTIYGLTRRNYDRILHTMISPILRPYVKGGTDSELLAFWLFSIVEDMGNTYLPECIRKFIKQVQQLGLETSLNFVFTCARTKFAAAGRYLFLNKDAKSSKHSTSNDPPSLYIIEHGADVIVSSEPVMEDNMDVRMIPKNSLVIINFNWKK